MTTGVSIASFQTQATSWAVATNPEYDHTTIPIRYGMTASASDGANFGDSGRTSRLFTQLFGPSQDSLTSMTLKLAKAPPAAVDPPIPPSRLNILSTLYDDPAFSPDPRSNPLFVTGHDSVWVSPPAFSALKVKTQKHPLPADIYPTPEGPQPQQPPTSLMMPKELHYLKQGSPPAPTPHLDPAKHGVSNDFHVTQSTKSESRAIYAEPVSIPQKKKTINIPFLRRMSLSTAPPKLDAAQGNALSTPISPSAPLENSARPRSVRNNTAPEPRTTPTRPTLAPRPATTSVKIKAPKGLRRMFESNRTKAPQLDKIDELDETNPLGLSLHHGGPYEALRHLTFQGPPKRAVPYNVGSQYAATSDKHQNHTSTNIQRESNTQPEAPQKPMRSPARPSQHHIDKPTRVASDERQRRMSSDVRPPVVPENSQNLLQAPPHGHIPIGAPLSISPGQILPPNFQPYSQMHLAQWSNELSRYPSPQNAPSPSDMGNQPAPHYHQHDQYQRENTLPDSHHQQYHHSMQQQHNLQQEHYPADQLPPALAQSTTASHASPSDPRRPRHYSMPTRNLVPPAYPTIPPPSSHDGAPSSPPLGHEPRGVETHIPRRASLVVSVTDEHMSQATQNTSPQPQPSQDGQAQPSIGSSGLLPARSRPIRDGSPPDVNRQVTPNGRIVQEQQRSEYGHNAPGEQRPPLGYHNSQVRSLASRPDPSRIPQTSLPLTYPPPMEQPEYDGVADASDTQGAKEMNSTIQTTPQYPQHLQPQRHPSRDTQSIQQSVTSSSNSSNSNRPRHQSRFAPKRLIMPAPLQSSVSVNTGSSLMHPGPQIQPRPRHDLYRNYPPQTGPHPQFRQQQAPPQIRGALPPSRTPSLHNQPATQAKDVRMVPQARKLQKRASIATPSDTSSVISPKTPLSFAPTPSYPQAYAPPLAHSKSDKAPKRVLSKRRNDM